MYFNDSFDELVKNDILAIRNRRNMKALIDKKDEESLKKHQMQYDPNFQVADLDEVFEVMSNQDLQFDEFSIGVRGDQIVYKIRGNKWCPGFEGDFKDDYLEIQGSIVNFHGRLGISRIDLEQELNVDSKKAKKLNEIKCRSYKNPYMSLDQIMDMMQLFISDASNSYGFHGTAKQHQIKNILEHMGKFHDILMRVSPTYRLVKSYENELKIREDSSKQQAQNEAIKDQEILELKELVQQQSETIEGHEKTIKGQNEVIQNQAAQIQEKDGIISDLKRRAREFGDSVMRVISKKLLVTSKDLNGVGDMTNKFIQENTDAECK